MKRRICRELLLDFLLIRVKSEHYLFFSNEKIILVVYGGIRRGSGVWRGGIWKREGKPMTEIQDLESAGLRPTFSRMSVLALFSKKDVPHLSAEEVHQKLHHDGYRIGLATVYRVLTQFEHAGLLSRHKWQDGRSVYELSSEDHHDHMICTACNRLVEFNDPVIEERKRKVAEEAGFVLNDHVLYLYVSCLDPACPGNNPSQ